MPYAYTNTRGDTYYLHHRMVTLAGHNTPQDIFYFSKSAGEQAIDAVPEGYEIYEGPHSALPVLRKKKSTALPTRD